MAGVIRFANPTENKIDITYNDQKTDEEKITQALVEGGVAIEGKQSRAPEQPLYFYK
jgi:hypothetical protein